MLRKQSVTRAKCYEGKVLRGLSVTRAKCYEGEVLNFRHPASVCKTMKSHQLEEAIVNKIYVDIITV